jgi:hypothetical protein
LDDPSDILAFEAHRPDGMDEEDIVFHHSQAAVYHRLIDGENVILSAPTSFGKSLIIDALLASGIYSNVVIVVPTLALIDETRRRLALRFGDTFKVNTHPGQSTSTRNIFVYTQERVVEQEEFPPVDLFIVDEFYKLNSPDEERTGLLNQAFYRLLKTGAQFYLLGPNVEAIAPDLPDRFSGHFIKTDDSTVAIDAIRVDRAGETDLESLVRTCRDLVEPTLIYCRSPRQTYTVAAALLTARVVEPSGRTADAAEWIRTTFDPEWLLADAVAAGIGIHNGRVPRSLGQYMVRAFNENQLRFLACTSTLIEGVNTAAKNVVIFDNKIAKQKFDYFTFNNIRGRSGRMFKHFVGRVFLFHPDPDVELPLVDVPALTQSASAPSSLLVQLDARDLTEQSRERLRPVLEQNDLSMDVVRANSGVAPEKQIEVASELRRRVADLHNLLAWTGYPTYDQLRETCNFVWRLTDFKGRVAGVSSGAQLAFKLSRLRDAGNTREFIEALAAGDRTDPTPDEKVESALEFIRQWSGHHLPRHLMTLDRIQKEVFASVGRRPGDYSFYSASVQGQFLPAPLAAAEEYGLPLDVAVKIQGRLRLGDGLDAMLDSLRGLTGQNLTNLTAFERALLLDTVRSLGRAR